MTSSYTAKDVAEFMKEQLDAARFLYQEDVVWKIEQQFGKPFVYDNEAGNLAIAKDVLAEFRKLTPDAVWERGEKCWRKRASYDDKGKRGQD